MDFLELVRDFDSDLKAAEEGLLTGSLEEYRKVTEHQSNHIFEHAVEEILIVVREKWREFQDDVKESEGYGWSDDIVDGYPPMKAGRKYWPKNADSVPTISRYPDEKQVRNLWYWEMTGTLDFTDRFVKKYGQPHAAHKETNVVRTEWGRREEIEEVVPKTRYLDEYMGLSALRMLSIKFWMRFVRTSVRRRVRTPLEQIARFFKFKLPWVHWIVLMDKPRDDEITKDLIYICKNPDFSSEALVDVPITEEGQVVYLVVCPNCGRKSGQGSSQCPHCGAGL